MTVFPEQDRADLLAAEALEIGRRLLAGEVDPSEVDALTARHAELVREFMQEIKKPAGEPEGGNA